MHGLALNVNPDLTPFSLINPCGLRERKVTSLARVLGQEIYLEEITSSFIGHFSEIFETGTEIGSTAGLRRIYEESLAAVDQMESAGVGGPSANGRAFGGLETQYHL
jgi:hypothetical protein